MERNRFTEHKNEKAAKFCIYNTCDKTPSPTRRTPDLRNPPVTPVRSILQADFFCLAPNGGEC